MVILEKSVAKNVNKNGTDPLEKVMDAEDYLRYRQQQGIIKPILIITAKEIQEAKKLKNSSKLCDKLRQFP